MSFAAVWPWSDPIWSDDDGNAGDGARSLARNGTTPTRAPVSLPRRLFSPLAYSRVVVFKFKLSRAQHARANTQLCVRLWSLHDPGLNAVLRAPVAPVFV